MEGSSITITPADTPLEWVLFVFNVLVISAVVLVIADRQLAQKVSPPHPYSTPSFWISFISFLVVAFALTFLVWSAGYFRGTGLTSVMGWFVIVFAVTRATTRLIPPGYKSIAVGLNFGVGFFIAISFFANIHTRW
jgi:hypothetical protein